MKTTNFLHFFYSLCLAIYSFPAWSSGEYHNTQAIRQQVADFIQNQAKTSLPKQQHQGLVVSVKNLDHRLRLSPCAKPLAFKLQSRQIRRNTTVKVSCNDQSPWSIYVSSQLRLELPVIVLRQGLARRHIIQKNDLIHVKKDVFALRNGYSTQAELLLGQELKRPLQAGDVLYSYHLKAPDIIKKGDRVTVIARRGGLSVMSQGTALSNASEGEKVRVENERSARIIQTRAISPGTVEVL